MSVFVLLFSASGCGGPFPDNSVAKFNDRVKTGDFNVSMALGDVAYDIVATKDYLYKFNFNISDNTLLSLATVSIYNSYKVDSYAELFNAEGESIASDDNSGEGNNFRITKMLSPGNYYLKVKDISTNACVFPCEGERDHYYLYSYGIVYTDDGRRIAYLPGEVFKYPPYVGPSGGRSMLDAKIFGHIEHRNLVPDSNNFLYFNLNAYTKDNPYVKDNLETNIFSLPPIGQPPVAKDFESIAKFSPIYSYRGADGNAFTFPLFGDKENNFYLYGDPNGDSDEDIYNSRHLIKRDNQGIENIIEKEYNYVPSNAYKLFSRTTSAPALGASNVFYTVDTEVAGRVYHRTNATACYLYEQCWFYNEADDYRQILRAVNITSANTLWSYELSLTNFSWWDRGGNFFRYLELRHLQEHKSSVVLGHDGTIYASSSNGLYAFSSNGSVKWHALEGISTDKLAIGLAGEVFVPTASQGVYAFSFNGSIKWHVDNMTDSNIFHGDAYYSGPVDEMVVGDDGTLYVASGGDVLAINSTGNIREGYVGSVENEYYTKMIAADSETVYISSHRAIDVINSTDYSLLQRYTLADLHINIREVYDNYEHLQILDMILDDGFLHIYESTREHSGHIEREIANLGYTVIQSIPVTGAGVGKRLAASPWSLPNGNLRRTNNAADDDYGNSISEAKPITVGVTISTSLSAFWDEDLFRLGPLANDGNLTIDIQGSIDGLQAELINGTSLGGAVVSSASYTDDASAMLNIEQSVKADETYYLRISSSSNGHYTIRTRF